MGAIFSLAHGFQFPVTAASIFFLKIVCAAPQLLDVFGELVSQLDGGS